MKWKPTIAVLLLAAMAGGCRMFKDCDCPSFSKNQGTENTEISEVCPV